jgi:hypothetical protein
MQVLLRANGLAPRVCVRPGVLLDFDADDVCRDQRAAELRAHELIAGAA